MQPEISSPSSDSFNNMKMNTIGSSTISDIMSQSPYSSAFFHPSLPSQSAFSASIGGVTAIKAAPSRATSAAITSLSRLMSEHQDLLNRHALCLSQLRKAFNESETLRQENTNLRIANRDLSNQLSVVIQSALLNSKTEERFCTEKNKREEENNGGCGGGCGGGDWDEGFSTESPTSVMENDRSDSSDSGGRVTLPKSISVRSNGFLKMNTQTGSGSSGGSNSGSVRGSNRVHSPNPVPGPQKVYVRGGGKKDGPIELDVYNQGMFKTELCNKWQETGACPYGDHCQFAHGIEELRPVIRHPRYKTEVCRMVLAGDHCPYGHRCHFRHTLSEQEKLMISLKLE